MAAGDKDGHVFGGHLSMAYVSATAEIQIQISDGVIDRKYDKKSASICSILLFNSLDKAIVPNKTYL